MQWSMITVGNHQVWKLESETQKAGSVQLIGDNWEFVPSSSTNRTRHMLTRMSQQVIGMIYSKLAELNSHADFNVE